MRRADRLFSLILALRSGKVRRADDLAEELEVSVRTVYRDIAHLQTAGTPIDGERGVGYLLRDGHFLPPLALSQLEHDALQWGVALAIANGDSALAAAARSLEAKLATVSGQSSLPTLAVYARPCTKVPSGVLAILRTAIREREVVAFDYVDAEERRTGRHVCPIELEMWDEVWTLTSWCELREDFRVFRVDRMSAVGKAGRRFSLDPGRSIDAYRLHLGQDWRKLKPARSVSR